MHSTNLKEDNWDEIDEDTMFNVLSLQNVNSITKSIMDNQLGRESNQ